MGKQEINIQDAYLFQYLKAGSTLRVDLTTGRTLEGKLKRFDRFALVLEHGGREVLVYKHAIATMEQQPAD
jgi:host factor-I protein